METINLAVFNTEGKEVETIKLDSTVFDGVINEAVIYQAIHAYRANQRRGIASTKTRGEVSGGGKKPWKQKGTGRARHGSTRSPLWRHGGVVFGPHPRDFSINLPQKIKESALKSVLNSKVKENNLMLIDKFSLDEVKTKNAFKIFSNLKLRQKKEKKQPSVLLLLNKTDENLYRATCNIEQVNINLATNTNAYEVLSCKKLLVTKDALTSLVKRLKK